MNKKLIAIGLACIVLIAAIVYVNAADSKEEIAEISEEDTIVADAIEDDQEDSFVKTLLLEMDARMNPNALLEVKMEVYDEDEKSEYIFTMKAKDNNQYLLLRYKAPERWKNTNMLMIKEDIWIYDRGSDRFMQVPRNLAFGGTDVAHGDMMRLNISQNYDGEIIDETDEYWQLELISNNKNVAYYGIRLTIDKENYYPIVAECFSKSGKHIKSIEYSDVKEMNGIMKPTKYTFLSPYEPDNYNVVTILNEALVEYEDHIFNIWAIRDNDDEYQ